MRRKFFSLVGRLAALMVILLTCGDAREDRRYYTYRTIADGPLINPYPKAVRAELYVAEFDYPDGDTKVVSREWSHKALTPAQLAQIESNILRRHPDLNGAVAACCDPHHFIRYYDKKGLQVGEVAICFCCGCVRTMPIVQRMEAQEIAFRREEMKALMQRLGVPIDVGCWHGADAP